MVEFHPIVWMFDYTHQPIEMIYGYMQDEVIYEQYKGTYADSRSNMISKEYGWNHGLSEVVNALIDAGLNLEFLNEYHESPYDILPNLVRAESGMFRNKTLLYPLIFEIMATKPR